MRYASLIRHVVRRLQLQINHNNLLCHLCIMWKALQLPKYSARKWREFPFGCCGQWQKNSSSSSSSSMPNGVSCSHARPVPAPPLSHALHCAVLCVIGYWVCNSIRMPVGCHSTLVSAVWHMHSHAAFCHVANRNASALFTWLTLTLAKWQRCQPARVLPITLPAYIKLWHIVVAPKGSVVFQLKIV